MSQLFKIRQAFYFVVLTVVLPLVFFLVLEMVLRFAWPQPPPNFSRRFFTERGGYKILIPGARSTNYGREFSVEVIGNEYGYREGTWPKEPIPGKTVWLFGDSFAFGWGVRARDTFAARLNEEGFALYNLGIPKDGWKEYQVRLEWAKRNLPKPDLILVATYDNDFVYLPNVIFKSDLAKRVFRFRYVLVTSQVGLLLKRICYETGLFQILAPHLSARANLQAAYGRDFSVHEKNYLDSTHGRMILTQMEHFIESARAITQKCVMVRITPSYCNGLAWQEEAIQEVGRPKEIYDFNRLDRELDQISKKHSAQYIKFSPKTDLETKNYYYRYDLHLTREGHHALADQVALALREDFKTPKT